jgi:pyruvate kinase
LAKDLEIEGYLTGKDVEVLECCRELGLNNVMASYVEQLSDLSDIEAILPGAAIVCKVESAKGIKFIIEHRGLSLMAARDDLFIELGQSLRIMPALRDIIASDPNAICASRVFSSLERRPVPDLADYCDLELMQSLGYRRFMLDDTVSHHYFNEAIGAWKAVVK